MCGRFNVTDDPFLQQLMQSLKLPDQRPKTSEDIAPGASISIVADRNQQRGLHSAIWWLLLDKETLKPNYRYTTFNSRSDQIHRKSALSYQAFRHQRCIIPASGFVEGLGDKKHYFQIQPTGQAIAFGGLYREWIHPHTGEHAFSASIITLPPHPKLKHIHPKSMPLMLPLDADSLDQWLDPDYTGTERFEHWLNPTIRTNLCVTPIDRPSRKQSVGAPEIITADL